jgi:restriction system protein
MKNKMWMVRAGERSILFQEFKEKGIVAIGWIKAGDLSHVKSPQEVKNIIWEKYADFKEAKKIISASQVIRFRFDFSIGDYVVTYNSPERRYLVGQIVGEYEYKGDRAEHKNIRKVKWIKEIGRDRLSTSTKNTLGAISTIFEIGEDAKTEIIDHLEGRAIEAEPSEAIEDELKEDIKQRAYELIKDKVNKLDWEDMQSLVAGILRAMGYKTRISPLGPDRGRDIEASPDGLGLGEPRVVVEVKHRTEVMGRQQITSFTGGLRPGHKAIYVSTGGFAKDAKYEAERSNIPVTLLDLDDLVELISQYYDSFDIETKALIPLTKIYWPE